MCDTPEDCLGCIANRVCSENVVIGDLDCVEFRESLEKKINTIQETCDAINRALKT